MRVLVIGGTSFIGPHVVRTLHEQGHAVAVFHRGQTEADLPPVVQHIRKPDGGFPITVFPAEAVAYRPDVVLHMIALVERDAQAAMQTFRGIARRIVVASSADVYRAFARLRGDESGPPEPVPLTETAPLREQFFPYRARPPRAADDPERWIDEYDKILVERAILSDPSLPGTILRLPMVYGPGDKQHRIFSYLKRMDDQRPAILLGEAVARWRNTRGYVENIAAAIALAVVDERAAGRIYNVAEAEALTEAEWVQQIGAAAGWPGSVVTLPEPRLPEHLQQQWQPEQDLIIDSTRLRHELGYTEQVDRAEALRRTVAWERAHPPAQIDPAQFDYAAEDAALPQASSR